MTLACKICKSNFPLINVESFLNKNLSFAPNCKWKSEDFANLIQTAISANTYMETIKVEGLPDPDTVHRKIHELNVDDIRKEFKASTKKIILQLKGKPVILIVDDTHEAFFGKTESVWINGYKYKKGCVGSYKFLAFSVLCEGKRYFVDVVPLKKKSNKNKIISSILKKIKKLLKIEAVLMDRGFCSSEIMDILEENGLKYIMLVPKKGDKLKKKIEKTVFYKKTTHTFYEGKENEKEFRIVIVKEKRIDKTIDWVFATNVNFTDVIKYIKIYKKRWNIETGFRVCDEALIKTKSVDISVRFLFFIFEIYLYNVWKFFEISIPFKRFLFACFVAVIYKRIFVKLDT